MAREGDLAGYLERIFPMVEVSPNHHPGIPCERQRQDEIGNRRAQRVEIGSTLELQTEQPSNEL